MATTRAYGNSTISVTTWAAETEYSVGDFVTPAIPNDRIYECVVGGTSGGTEPSWNTSMESTVRDSSVTWLCLNAWLTSPLTVVLDTDGIGGAPYKGIWVRIPNVEENTDFIVYGSHTGLDGTWRQIDELTVPHGDRDSRYKGLTNAYRFIKVVAAESVDAEIEIVAGE